MIRLSFMLLIYFCVLNNSNAQVPLTRQQLLGTWEVDYSTIRNCKDGHVKPAIVKGRRLLTFKDSLNYDLILGSTPYSGYYDIDLVQGDIIFTPVNPTETLEQTRNKVTFIDDKQLILLESACGVMYEQSYHKVKPSVVK